MVDDRHKRYGHDKEKDVRQEDDRNGVLCTKSEGVLINRNLEQVHKALAKTPQPCSRPRCHKRASVNFSILATVHSEGLRNPT